MGPYMSEISEDHADFVKSRLGSEFQLCRAPDVEVAVEPRRTFSPWKWTLSAWHRTRSILTNRLVRWMMGHQASVAFDEALFRCQGEIHRWMYDRFSLRELCQEVGFVDFTVQTAFDSQIEGYADYELDSIGDQVRKPDSLFVECRKPAVGMRASA